jgi:hypothetical protein
MSVSIIDMLRVHFKTLLKWEVTEVKIFYTNLGNCTESKIASKVTESVCCSYDANFELI